MPAAAPPGIGNKLRIARLDRSLSIEETAWRTRMRPELLRALECDEYEALGHQSFVRSHLHSYARFLGIDPTEVVDEFSSLVGEEEPSSIEQLDRRARVARKPPRPKWLIAATVSGAVLIAAASFGVLGGQAERPAADPILALSAPAPSSPVPVPAAEARVRLRIEAVAETTVSVLADGEQIFEGVLRAGQARTFNAQESIEILVADAGALTLSLNGERLGSPGERGDSFRGRFGPRGPIDG